MSNKPPFVEEKVKLSDLCHKGSSSLRQKDLTNEGAYPVYGASGIVGTMSTYQNSLPYVCVIKDGAGVGRAIACDAYSSVLGTMQALIPKDRVNNDFLLHLIRSLRLGDGFSGSTIPHIYFKDYGNLRVPNYTAEQQSEIAQIFNCVEDLLSQHTITLDKLDQLIKSRFVEMFGNQKDNELSLPQVKLDRLAFVGSSKRVFKNELLEKGIPFLRGTEVGAYGFGKKLEPELFISRQHYEELVSHTGKPEIGDLLLPSICPDGQIWEVDIDEPFYFKDGRVLWIKPKHAYLSSTFLRFALKNYFESDFQSIASGTTFAELKIINLKKLDIALPPLELQQEFADFVAEVDKLRFVVNQQIDKLQTLYDSLAQEYFGD